MICLRRGERVTVKAPGFQEVEVDRNDWWKIVEIVQEKKPGLPDWSCLLDYSICPLSVVDDFSRELFSAYQACDGVARIRTPAELYALPPIYLEAVGVIDGVLNRVRTARRGNP